MRAERRRLSVAVLLSVLLHMLLFSLTLGGQGPGLPGFGLPWQERRVEAPDLRVVLMPARIIATAPAGTSQPLKEPARQASIGQRVAGGPAPTPPLPPPPAPPLPPAPTLGRTAEVVVPQASPAAPQAKAEPEPTTAAAAAQAPVRSEAADGTAPPPNPQPVVIAGERADAATFVVPAAPSVPTPVPTPVIAAAPSAASPQNVMPAPRDAGDARIAAQERVDADARQRAAERATSDRSQQEAQREALQLETARIEAARQEAERREAARQAAAREDAQRVEAARLDAERQEAVRLATTRQEATRQEAARQETQRAETTRLEAERQDAARQAAARQAATQEEAARQEASRQEAQRVETGRQEAARQAASRQEAARIDAAQDEARREARLRAIGRQLDEEAAKRDAAATAAGLPPRLAPSSSGGRRGRLFGRTDANAELVLYAEAWARKIQLNMTFDMVRDAAKRPHTQPLVTVAIRSDGSVESVTFVLSSGVAEIDEAIRRIVQSQLPYQAFSPALAREFDVIEIRRTWHFDTAVRLY